MHDPMTLAKANAAAVGAPLGQTVAEMAKRFQAQGKYVLLSKDGLHVTALETFSHPDEANAALSARSATATASENYVLLTPATTPSETI